MGKRILIITGGDSGGITPPVAPATQYDLVIAADGGLDRAMGLGVRPDLVVGDLDSASPGAIDEARELGTAIDAHPAEKDHTDFELALQRAIAEEASEIAVIGGGGGRPDHWLANLSLLAATAARGVTVTADIGGWSVSTAAPGQPYSEEHEAGQLVSLLPIGGDARGVVTDGLAYPLDDEDLMWGSSRGVSNVSRAGVVSVEVRNGTLLVMARHGREADTDSERNSR